MSFKDVLGHARPIELLKRAIRSENVAHSYLFLGNEGIGKKWVALQFAKALNCLGGGAERGDSCDHCLSCKKIDGHLHPDVHSLQGRPGRRPDARRCSPQRVRKVHRPQSLSRPRGGSEARPLARARRLFRFRRNFLPLSPS